MKLNDKCTNPPCWNPPSILEKCPENRCPTINQQCSIGSTNYNLPGFICKNEKNENPKNDPSKWCNKPPCWHSAPQYTNSCDDGRCSIVGQKCGTEDKYNKICLNKSNESCNTPPCWHSVPENIKCNKILLSQNKEYCKRTEECNYEGNCQHIGQKCTEDGVIKYECMNKKKYEDTLIPDSSLVAPDKRFCNNPPCWYPIDGGIPPDPKLFPINQLNDAGYKNSSFVNILDRLDAANVDYGVYQFTSKDREGTITFLKLYDFMQDNWVIFESNCIESNALILWNKYTGNTTKNGTMNYTEFSNLMTTIDVEKFKYREGKGRIAPKFMPIEEYNKLTDLFPSTG